MSVQFWKISEMSPTLKTVFVHVSVPCPSKFRVCRLSRRDCQPRYLGLVRRDCLKCKYFGYTLQHIYLGYPRRDTSFEPHFLEDISLLLFLHNMYKLNSI